MRDTGVLLAEVQSHFLEGLLLLVANLLQLCLLVLELPQLLKQTDQTPDTLTFFIFFLTSFSDPGKQQGRMLFESKKFCCMNRIRVTSWITSHRGDCRGGAPGVALRWGQ